MAELGPDSMAEVATACQGARAEIAAALERTFERTLDVEVGQPGQFDPASPPSEFEGPGLLLVMQAEQAAVALVPEAAGLLPGWYAAPSPSEQSRLATLAQELAVLVFPAGFQPDRLRAGRVEHLGQALAGRAREEAAVVPLVLSGGGAEGRLLVVWPVEEAGSLLPAPASAAAAADAEEAEEQEPPGSDPQPRGPSALSAAEALELARADELPPYAQSLLKIRVPVVVSLASRKQPVGRIVELGPGSILQFDKPCDEMLDLEVGGQTIAQGEAVKVGDKFGLRITTLVLPGERFEPLQKPRP